MQNIPEIEELVKLISKLPGLGPKSSRRIILKLINNREEIHKPMVNAMANVFKNISRCKKCGTLKSNISNCNNCENSKNKYNKICVVENLADQYSVESAGVFQGYFHILGGTVSNSNNQRKEDLLVESLVDRVKKDNIEEVILATSTTVEGSTTNFYIIDKLKNAKVKISILAKGLPIGAELGESLDDGTLIAAFKNRKEFVENKD